MSEPRQVGVLGCGLMGSGIAQVVAQAGYRTIVREIGPEQLDAGLARIGRQLARLEEKERISADERERVLARIRGTTELSDLADCDLVIEAVVEDLEVKRDLWSTLDGICRADAVFASNTSSLTIADMAAGTRHPERLIGLHFFNPVPVMALVEVVRSLATAEHVVAAADAFVRSLGKEPIHCGDRSGFVVNRLLVPYLLDAIRAVEQGVASIAEVDRAMTLGAGHPMGPLTLCDFVGNDTLARIGDIMFREYRDPRFAPPSLLRRMVSFGYFGRKSGRGFYDYRSDPPEPSRLDI